jgi:prepilin-type N-terminal cleavage/methylation domain-containing protein
MKKYLIAFTLIELLVVIAIIGILSGLIIVTMSGVTDRANIAKSQVFSNSLKNALMLNLVSEWKFDQVNSPSTNQTPDLWSSNNCTLSGTTLPQLQTSGCVSGNCLSFDGLTSYLNCGNGINLNIREGITLSFWIKPNDLVGCRDILEKADNYEPYRLYIQDDFVVFQLSQEGGTRRFAQTAAGVVSTNWQNVVATYNKSSVNFYINGVSKENIGSTPTYSLRITTYDLYIGRRYSFNSCYFKGLLDDVRIYNAAIPTSQIKEQYYIGLNNLLAGGSISSEEYQSRLSLIAKN